MLLKINPEGLEAAISSIGAHPQSLPIFNRKCEIIPLKLKEVRTPAINIIKQEMLGYGGDAVTPAGAIVNKDKYGDVLLLGTEKQYKLLVAKLRLMNYFGLGAVADEIEAYFQPQSLQTVLADGRVLTYDKVRIMGILNVTPDSFYEGSRVNNISSVLKKAEQMLLEGADILDIGGESTRPGSEGITGPEERKRVLPVVEAIRAAFPQAIISVDTWHSGTAEASLDKGADIINDITALEGDKRMLGVVQRYKAPVVLMHMRGTPKNMQDNCEYKDVVEEIALYLAQRAQVVAAKELGRDKVILDPGIGFAKNVQQNLLLMRDLSVLKSLGYPVLLAASRKSTIGKVLGDIPADERLAGTMATSLQAVYAGAHMVRVHDVKENLQAIRMLEAIREPEKW